MWLAPRLEGGASQHAGNALLDRPSNDSEFAGGHEPQPGLIPSPSGGFTGRVLSSAVKERSMPLPIPDNAVGVNALRRDFGWA